MKRGLGTLLLSLGTLARIASADFLFEYPLPIGEFEYRAVIILPEYYDRFFGLWDVVDLEISLQRQSPVAPKTIQAVKRFLQHKYHQVLESEPMLQGRSLSSREFDLFNVSETFEDERSALFAIIGPDLGLRGLVRLSSISDVPSTNEHQGFFNQFLPLDLRVNRSKDAPSARRKGGRKVNFVDMTVPFHGFDLYDYDSVIARSTTIRWFEGVEAEIKGWFHSPEAVKVGGKTVVLDFMPDLLDIVHMYGGIERSGLSIASFGKNPDDVEPLKHLLGMLSQIFEREITEHHLGIRIGTVYGQAANEERALQYQRDFGMTQYAEARDPDFNEQPLRLFRAPKPEFATRIQDWSEGRPGHQLRPLSRLLKGMRYEHCSGEILNAVPFLKHFEDPLGIGITWRDVPKQD